MSNLRNCIVTIAAAAWLQSAAGGLITMSVGGIAGANWEWDVPLLHPGDTWEAWFYRSDNGSYVDGYVNAGVRANGRYAWFTITDFRLGSDHAVQLNFDCLADLDFATIFDGYGAPLQIFLASQSLNSGNARMDWSKGARWNNTPLPPLAGHFAPNDMTSSLFGVSGAFDYFTSPINLFSQTTIVLRTGGLADEIQLPESAHDEIEIPAPAALAALGGLLAFAARRRT